jgi:ClpP class serine protease
MTGSIGLLFAGLDFSGLTEKLGIENPAVLASP